MDKGDVLTSGIVVADGKGWMEAFAIAGVGTSTPDVLDETNTVTSKYADKPLEVETALWGSDNLLPHQITTDVKGVTVISAGLRKKAKIHYGQGLIIVKEDENGKPEKVREGTAFDFFKKNRLNKKLIAHISDMEWYQLSFVEYILNEGFTEIVKVSVPSAPYCRISVQEEDLDENGFSYFRSKWIVYSKQWVNAAVTEETSEVIALIDPEWSVEYVKEYCKANGIKKFIRPVTLYMPETDYYPEPYWTSARTSGWVEIAQLIPKVKKAIIQNSMTLKYLVKIPHDYFIKKYPNHKEAERKAAMDEDLSVLNDFLSNYENTGSSIVTYYDVDKHTQKMYGHWEIDVIDNNLKDGVLNLDSASANSEILFAIGIDPTLVGSGMPGKEMGAKSGSDKREAFNIAVADAAVDREVTSEFVYFIADFNGWDTEEQYVYENTILATTDKQPTGIEKKI